MSECPHIAGLPRPEPAPASDTCPECVAAGTVPVHLRLCLECGHVGCCDSSPLQHATAHFAGTGHPVMRSFEPGEDWRWCFVDESLV
ncbi:UBP-type zinc finger domain-containing protein [Streptomyces yaizuensis]|uniref:UBP-type zinc finger domain-containing protein n=1 Tax=Streptomyces yaizuensis TaxID=2989713 RepID=A0ABQ5NWS8_9ACTN|nr:UBP-type zinc finger domain-containing protein [Streptomyces sp. YSPA8]GLF94583.1 UBP-type zinc finger domain-containing protein [Streptomyces sp. YSPA8]